MKHPTNVVGIQDEAWAYCLSCGWMSTGATATRKWDVPGRCAAARDHEGVS
jgi:hypothetical protein